MTDERQGDVDGEPVGLGRDAAQLRSFAVEHVKAAPDVLQAHSEAGLPDPADGAVVGDGDAKRAPFGAGANGEGDDA